MPEEAFHALRGPSEAAWGVTSEGGFVGGVGPPKNEERRHEDDGQGVLVLPDTHSILQRGVGMR